MLCRLLFQLSQKAQEKRQRDARRQHIRYGLCDLDACQPEQGDEEQEHGDVAETISQTG